MRMLRVLARRRTSIRSRERDLAENGFSQIFVLARIRSVSSVFVVKIAILPVFPHQTLHTQRFSLGFRSAYAMYARACSRVEISRLRDLASPRTSRLNREIVGFDADFDCCRPALPENSVAVPAARPN